ncbi:MAG: hypothetical protein Q8Q56_02860 [Alphaproteobacteria bacterium]|nr:hypothetical protein [Alphaproteobacteria bacterium]
MNRLLKLKLNLNLVITLSLLLITNVLGSSALNLDTKPYAIPKKDLIVKMVSATRNGLTTCVPKTILMSLEEISSETIKQCPHHILDICFWAAVHNSFHKIAYKIAESLFADFFPPQLIPFPRLSNRSKNETINILFIFYSIMAKIHCKDFSSEDRDWFELQAAKIKPE